jgi:hypothetical protein
MNTLLELIPTTTTAQTQAQSTTPVFDRINDMASELWEPIHEQLMALIKCRVPKFKLRFTIEQLKFENEYSGWWVIDSMGGIKSIPSDELPSCLVFDVESTKEHSQINELSGEPDYQPFLAVAYGIPKGQDTPLYYVWVGDVWLGNNCRLIDFPKDRTVITWNGATHDSKFMSCESEGEILPIIHVDVMALLTMYRGICDDKQQAKYSKYLKSKASGKAAPEWFKHATPVSLADAARNVLGIPIVKGIDRNDPEAPQNVIEYCAQDVSITMQLLQKIYPILHGRFVGNAATWVGMASTTGLSILLEDSWGEHCDDLMLAMTTPDVPTATKKAWLSYHQHEYAGLYINNGAAKIGINPVGDPITRFPKSGVWCHGHSEYLPAFTASKEVGFTVEVELTRPARLMDAAGDGQVCSPLLNVSVPESIEFETGKESMALGQKFVAESWAVDLLHTALTVINYELVNRELEARVCDFYRTADSIVIGLIGDEKDSDQLRAIADMANELCHDLINETSVAYEAAF